MTGSTVPDPGELVRAKVRWASRYVEVGWKVFVLGRDKTPLSNCGLCRAADWTHDRETCPCLTCHGFYAATDDVAIVEAMVTAARDGWLAVRTGAASNLLVLDFEAAPNAEGVTGLDTLDQWEMWTQVELPPTLRQRTQSGGLHLLYRIDSPIGPVVKSRNRVLPQTDVKAEGGYVAVPTPGRPERTWDTSFSSAAVAAGPQLLDALEKLRGRSSGGGSGGSEGSGSSVAGYDYARYLVTGCPGGARDQFFNDLLFRARKQGYDRARIETIARYHWERCEQPPATEWYMPWEHVEYKLDRIWQTVAPPSMPAWRPDGGRVVHVVGETDEGKTIVKQGNTAVVRSEW